jgi:cell wall-associated NlpC family hydrolase
LALCFAGPDAWGLAEHYKQSLKSQLLLIIDKHPKYTWGGSSDLETGIDCSGYVFLAAKWAGIPGITRTTSSRMSLGLGGWPSKDVDLSDATECDLLFWTFNKEQPAGHVGVLLLDEQDCKHATHASERRGVVLDALAGPISRNLTKVRRLSIGD